MNRLLFLTLMVFYLVACTSGATGVKSNCSIGREVCVEIEAVEPVRWGEPITVKITVISNKPMKDTSVSISHDRGVVIESSQNWEKGVKEVYIGEFSSSWKVDLNAGKPLVFIRKFLFPSIEGPFRFQAGVLTFPEAMFVSDTVTVYLTHEGGKVYYSGTPIPIPGWTPGEPFPAYTADPSMLATLHAIPTSTPYSATPGIEALTPPSQQVTTPTAPPYPAPLNVQATPTSALFQGTPATMSPRMPASPTGTPTQPPYP